MKLDIFPEIHCEECGEIVHNHFVCPVCKEVTETDAYCDIDDYDKEFGCEKCKTRFKLNSDGYAYSDNAEWAIVNDPKQ